MKIAIVEKDGAIRQRLRQGDAHRADEIVDLGCTIDLMSYLADPFLRVVILDWSCLDPVAPELCRQVRERPPADPYIYVIAVIGLDRPTPTVEVFHAGVDAVLMQPFDPDELTAWLDVARRICAHEDNLRGRSWELEQIRRDLESQNSALSEIASSDPLTGLRNRRYFGEALEAQFSLARRKQLPISLVMIDVDHFKSFNDRFGHPAGDEVLRTIGHLLRSCVREHDIVARYGGEEFAILLPTTDEDECLPLVERLRTTVANHPWPFRGVTISLGVATLDPGESLPSNLVDRADRALYYSKALGRNRSSFAHNRFEFAVNPLHDRLPAEPLRPQVSAPS